MTRKFLIGTFSIVTVVAVIFSLQSCSKLASSLVFNNLVLQPAAITVVVPPTSDTSISIPLGAATNNYNVDSFIKANTANQLGVSNITSVKLTSCIVTITKGNTTANNFANFESCAASFYTNNNTTPYTISINNPDVAATTLTLPVDTSAQLVNYLSSSTSTFTYSVNGKLRRPTTDSITCVINYSFTVSAKG